MKHRFEDMKSMAKQKFKENREFLDFLENLYDEQENEIDDIVYNTVNNISSEIDCTICGKCCSELKPILDEEDQYRLSEQLQITIEKLQEEHLEYNIYSFKEPVWHLRHTPCPFLHSKKCTIYEYRPKSCRIFPNLNVSGPDKIRDMVADSFTCPILFFAIEKLKTRLNFLPE